MELELGYNRLVNEAFKRLGEVRGNTVIVHPEFEETARKFVEALAETVLVEIVAINDISKTLSSVQFCGATVAKASGRDTGAYVPGSVTFISGCVSSGGSRAYYSTDVKAGTVFRLRVPKIVYEKHANKQKTFTHRIVAAETSIEELL